MFTLMFSVCPEVIVGYVVDFSFVGYVGGFSILAVVFLQFFDGKLFFRTQSITILRLCECKIYEIFGYWPQKIVACVLRYSLRVASLETFVSLYVPMKSFL
jgi:hypothetical protein